MPKKGPVRDIRWAAEQLDAGRKVRRPFWTGALGKAAPESKYLTLYLRDVTSGAVSLSMTELLATDWELAGASPI